MPCVETVPTAYAAEQWHELFVMAGGAAAALAGLLFVALSINLDRILAGVGLSRRAAETVILLAALLLLSVFVLTPQPTAALGWETLVTGLVVLGELADRLVRHVKTASPTGFSRVVPAVIVGAVGLPAVVAGVSLLLGSGGGLYWLIVALVMGFAGALTNAWVLMVEILR